jgi:lysozyme family protein
MMGWQQDASFNAAVAVILQHEGGAQYTNDPRDPGGATKYGISKRSHPDVDVVNLTEDGAKAIYYSDYWLPLQAEKLIAPLPADLFPFGLATKVLDMAVPCGLTSAVQALQRAIRSAHGPWLFDSGVIDQRTLDAVQRMVVSHEAGFLVVALRSEYAAHCRLVAAHYSAMNSGRQDPYINGWLVRAYA